MLLETNRMSHFYAAAPCLAVADIGASIRWYEKNLAFIGDPFPSHEPFVFAILRRNDIEIMLQRIEGYEKPELYNRRSGGVWDAYMRIKGVKELYASIKDKVEIVQPLRQQPYGCWEFEVKDPNGYVLVFSE
jgi:hypothetical protein